MSTSQSFIRDANGATYRLGTLLGRGLFANTFTTRSEDGTDWIVKISLGPEDFPENMQNLVKISRGVMDEQWQMLSRRPSPHLLAPANHFISEDGRYCLLYPRHDIGFKQLLGQTRSFPELLRLLTRCTQALSHLPSGLCPHGNIHPNNLFWDGQNILFMDPLTPLLRLHHADFLKAKGLTAFTPPEYRNIRNRNSAWSPSVATDTHSLALLLMGRLVRDCELEICTHGITKIIENNLAQSLELLLNDNASANAHFHERVSKQTMRLLDRALNTKWEPSPPYRFGNLQDFQQRLQNIIDLINPTVAKVGPVLFGGPLGRGEFEQDDEIKFSCSIHTTPPLEDHEDITTGTILVDLNRDSSRVEGYDLWVDVSRLNGGRLRFQFGLTEIPPGDYGLYLGFRINGSLATPKQAYAEFQVIANVGYAPPAATVPPKTLQFPSALVHSGSQESNPATAVPSPNDEQTPKEFESLETPANESSSGSEGRTTENPGIQRHPLLEGRVAKPSLSNAVIRVPNISAVRPKMEMPDSEFASISEPLSMIHPLPQTENAFRPKKQPILTVVACKEPEAMIVGELHSSPFNVQLESLVEFISEQESEQESVYPYSQEDSSDGDPTGQLDGPDFTDGFSESIDIAHQNKAVQPAPQPHSETKSDIQAKSPQYKGSDPEDVEDIVRQQATKIREFVLNDPFAIPIIGLVGLILLLGGVFLVIV